VHDIGVEDLVEAWTALLARHTADPNAATVGDELIASWSEPHRRYHSVVHLRDILSKIDLLADYADNLDAIRLAAWYHDAVYQGLADDEELSARRAESELSELGLAPELVAEVARLVRMTAGHSPEPGDRNGEVLSDADLAPLAIPRDRYQANTAIIREEYAHVSDEAFHRGRLRVVVRFLDGSGVFRTEYGRQNWEAIALDNLRAELETLSG